MSARAPDHTRHPGESGNTEGGPSRHLGPRLAALMIGGMACFGSATPVSRVVGRSFPVWLGSTLRMIVAAAVLGPLVVVQRRRRGDRPLVSTLASLATADRWRIVVLGVIGTFGFTAFMLIGMREAPGAVGAVVMASTPAVTGGASVLFLGEPLTRKLVLAFTAAVAGIAVVNLAGGVDGTSGGLVVVGSLLVFGAVCCEATYTLVGKELSADLDPMTVSLAAALVGAIAFVPLAAWDLARFDWATPNLSEWVGVMWWGAGTMALGSVLWFAGVRRVEGTTASVFMGVMPVSALGLSYVILGEEFRWAHLAGMALVLAGIGLAVAPGDEADPRDGEPTDARADESSSPTHLAEDR